jgi:hypothetical protein
MKYEDNLKRIAIEFVEYRIDGYGDQVPLYHVVIDGRPVGFVMIWEKAKGIRHWLATTLQDLEQLVRTPALSAAASADIP